MAFVWFVHVHVLFLILVLYLVQSQKSQHLVGDK